MKNNTGNIIVRALALIFAVTTFTYGYLYYKKQGPDLNYDKAFIQKQVDSLKAENKRLHIEVIEEGLRSTARQKVIDSLENDKSKTKIVYENKIKEVDAASSNTDLGTLRDIFSKNNIK